MLSDLVGVNMENFEWFNIPIKGKSLYSAYHQACSVFTVYSLQHSKFSIFYVPEFKFFGQFSIKEVGVYVFGGMKKMDILPSQLLILKIGKKFPLSWLAPKTIGQGPCGRMLHTMTFMDKMNILIIYGGRNQAKECFLKDIHGLNLDSLTWASLTIFGKVPGGRSSHCAAGFE